MAHATIWSVGGGQMKQIILILALLITIGTVYAQETCKYNGLTTTFSALSFAQGVKAEYAGEQFVRLSDPKAITNLEQLRGLTCLEHADFYNQGVSGDLESLKDLTNLKVFSLHTNPEVTGDICALSNAVKLKSLKFATDEKVYGDISCLKDLNLETFAVRGTKISGDISSLSHMSNLKALYISDTGITGDISALGDLANLEELGVSDEPGNSKVTGDLASLDKLTKLKKAVLFKTKATNCAHFLKMHPNIDGGCIEATGFSLKTDSATRSSGDGRPVLPILVIAGLAIALFIWFKKKKK